MTLGASGRVNGYIGSSLFSDSAKVLVTEPRVTNVDPLPDEVLDRYYWRPERDEVGVDRLIKAQATGGRE